MQPDTQIAPQAPTSPATGSISPIAVNAAKAIRQVESGGNYQATSKDGSYGAYQFLQSTWNAASQKYLGQAVPWKSATREQQNEVAVKQINDWIQSGKATNVGQLASMWNAGEGNPNAYLQGTQGTNSSGVKYNVPAYAQKVATEYQKIKGGSGIPGYAAPNPVTPIDLGQQSQSTDTNASPTLGSNLHGRLQDAQTGLNSIIGGESGSGQSRLSGALQVAGAAAGGIGDVVNAGLELIPGVKGLEGLIGQGAGALAKTSVGQSVSKAIQSFSDAHPELSKDIGAGFNIVTAIPILKGLGVAGSVAKDAIASSLQGVAEKSVQNGLEGAIGKAGLRGAKFLADNPTLAKDMVEERALPAVQAGKYNSLGALKDSQGRISNFNAQVESALNNEKYTTSPKVNIGDTVDVKAGDGTVLGEGKKVNDIQTHTDGKQYVKVEGSNAYTPIENITKQGASNVVNHNEILSKAVANFPHSEFTPADLLDNAKSLTPQNNKLWTKFANGEASLKETNLLRSNLDTAVKSVYTSTNQPPITKEMGASLAGAMRQYVQSNAPETQQLFSNMSKEFRIQKALGYLHNKTVSSGLVGAGEKAGSTIAGEAIGATHGMPLVGGFIGRQIGEGISKRIAGIPEAILERTGKNAARTSLKELGKKAALGAVGTLAQQANR